MFKGVKVTDRLARMKLKSWATITDGCINRSVQKVLIETKGSAFSSLEQHSIENHILDSTLRDDHRTILLKSVVELYINNSFHRFSRIYTEQIMRKVNLLGDRYLEINSCFIMINVFQTSISFSYN